MSDSQNDPRRQALKRGLEQLSDHQLQRLRDHIAFGLPLCLDGGNYDQQRAAFCPLGVAVGLDAVEWGPETELRSDTVRAVLTILGYTVSNTRGVEGQFYQYNRLADLKALVYDILTERTVTAM